MNNGGLKYSVDISECTRRITCDDIKFVCTDNRVIF